MRSSRVVAMLVSVGLGSACSGEGSLRLVYIANEGILAATDSSAVVIDALYDAPNPAYAAPSEAALEALIAGADPFEPVDLVLVTHDHPDHFAPSVVSRFLSANPRARLVAPVDAVETLKALPAWGSYEDRVIPLTLGVGESKELAVDGIRVKAVRTLHSGERESPMNVMYLVQMDGWALFHDGDSNHLPETFRTAMDGAPPLDLAVVGDWFPWSGEGKLILDEILKSRFVGLGHRPLDPGTLTADSFAVLGETYFLFDHPGERWELPPS
jgi:L-ascorbate metabolism protein UlaG (beta-lactamase superfamily)